MTSGVERISALEAPITEPPLAGWFAEPEVARAVAARANDMGSSGAAAREAEDDD